MEDNDEHSLDQFRKQWRRELEQQYDDGASGDGGAQESSATTLFQQAVELEKSRKYFDAIRLYRRALQLDPNIELKIYQASQAHEQTSSSSSDFSNKNSSSHLENFSSDSNDLSVDDLIESFQKELSLGDTAICESAYQAGTIRTGLHISSLPVEVFLLILKYVVSNDLDFKSLERFGRVCKGKWS
jgi:F-box protein 9